MGGRKRGRETTKSATQSRALTGNWAGDFSLCGTMPNPLSHTGQGEKTCFRQYAYMWAKISRTAFMANCITDYFSFCSVENIGFFFRTYVADNLIMMLNTCISLLKTISWFRELVHVSNWALAWPISQRGGPILEHFPNSSDYAPPPLLEAVEDQCSRNIRLRIVPRCGVACLLGKSS